MALHEHFGLTNHLNCGTRVDTWLNKNITNVSLSSRFMALGIFFFLSNNLIFLLYDVTFKSQAKSDIIQYCRIFSEFEVAASLYWCTGDYLSMFCNQQ